MIGRILASTVLSLRLWLVGSCVGCLLVGEALVRDVLLPVERSSSNSLASRNEARHWLWFIRHFTVSAYGTKLFYGRSRAWISIRVWQVHKLLTPICILLLGRFRHQAINFVWQAGKDLGRRPPPPRPRCHSKQTTTRHECQAIGP